MTTLPNQTNAIEAAVAKAINGIVGADDDRRGAKDMLTEAGNKATATREGAIIALAGLSHTHKWDAASIIGGVEAAVSKRNDKSTAIATFAAEVKRACNPHVREHVPALFKLAHDAWDAEGEVEAKPMRKAFARCYHMVVGPMFEQAQRGNVFADQDTLRAFAVERDPSLDPAKVMKRLNALKAQLAGFYEDFPDQGIKSCLDYLSAVEIADLERARGNVAADDNDASGDTESEPVAEGASDILADVLGEMVA